MDPNNFLMGNSTKASFAKENSSDIKKKCGRRVGKRRTFSSAVSKEIVCKSLLE
jgi:hypothetical protein